MNQCEMAIIAKCQDVFRLLFRSIDLSIFSLSFFEKKNTNSRFVVFGRKNDSRGFGDYDVKGAIGDWGKGGE